MRIRKTPCGKCGGPTELGFLVDHAHSNAIQALWVKGEPERGWLHSVKTRGKLLRRIYTTRCLTCGFLESYAQDPA